MMLYAATKTENKTGEEKKPSTLKPTGTGHAVSTMHFN